MKTSDFKSFNYLESGEVSFSFEEAREQAILKAIKLCQNKK